MTVFWIIAGLVFVALAPVISLRPSLRQRRIVALRTRARELGFRVEVNPPGVARPEHGDLLAYRLHYPKASAGPEIRWTRETQTCEMEKGMDADDQQAVHALIESLPEDALALTSGTATLTLWWQERLDLPEFDQLAEGMDALRHQLAGKRRRNIRE
ncbi:hypothetical protein [Larsenimonas rhizosphaerae]|uniref:hypothetical protein n=1 Tax=Larsenimonas rhizosphaerae TaxID=2944682 RepID=UPI0020340E75|nr:hypothetical protein [Larsenimonas rhizosphaerae]MCM2131177.1 hypothetical protein [Larsenimonas rhizosphaerae]